MKITRREYLKLCLATGAAFALKPLMAWAGTESLELITRPIPSTGERLPAVGLGSSATFRSVAEQDEFEAVSQVLRALIDHGGRIFDTAPGYGASEAVAGAIAHELGVTDKLFWATKLNVAGRDGGTADPEAARVQLQQSFERARKAPVDLVQVHNLGDVPTQLALLKDLKAAERIRYIGVTTTFPRQYADLEAIMRREPLDFIGIDYAIDNRAVEERILPLAQDRGIAVLVYAPFGRTRLWERVRGREVPEWAAEFDAHSWAQLFLKFVLAHPAVTAATPATSRASHMVDNMGGALGRLPDREAQRRMLSYLDPL